MTTRRGLFRFSGMAAIVAAVGAVFPEFARAEVLPGSGDGKFVDAHIGASGHKGTAAA